MAVVMVGDAKEMALGDLKHASATLASLSGGVMKHLPLRDPMTMKPMPTP